MKEIFDFKRFGKYFRYDLSHAVSNYWMTAIILGLFPIIWLVFKWLFTIISGEHGIHGDEMYVFWPFIIMVVVIMSFGPRVYGKLTDKKTGADWITMPASAEEKTLSLLIITCIVLPACMYALTVLGNTLVPSDLRYSESVLPFKSTGLFDTGIVDLRKQGVGGNFFNAPLLIWLNWCENILAFTLGALCFKRNKVGKTILCLVGFGILMSGLTMLIFHTQNFNTEDLASFFGDFDADRAQFWINLILNAIYTIVFVVLIGAIYARIKTIKA